MSRLALDPTNDLLLLIPVVRTSYSKDQPFSRLLENAVCLPLFDGGNS